MRKTKNDELVQEQEQQCRNNNIIVHGMSEELKDTTVPLKSQDDYFITSLMEILGVDKVPTSIVQLGKPGPGKIPSGETNNEMCRRQRASHV